MTVKPELSQMEQRIIYKIATALDRGIMSIKNAQEENYWFGHADRLDFTWGKTNLTIAHELYDLFRKNEWELSEIQKWLHSEFPIIFEGGVGSIRKETIEDGTYVKELKRLFQVPTEKAIEGIVR